MLSQNQGHTPKSSTPLSSQQDGFSAPHPYSTLHQTTNQAAARLHAISTPHHWLLQDWEFPESVSCCLADLPVHLSSLANQNPGHSGKGGVHSSRKQWLGEGCKFMLHILWIGAHGRKGETVQAHPLTTACEHATILSLCRYAYTRHDPLSYLPDKIQTRPLHLKIPFYSVQFF